VVHTSNSMRGRYRLVGEELWENGSHERRCCEFQLGDLDGGCTGYTGYYECASSGDIAGDTTACVKGMRGGLDLQ
jgi:hypothetical protein